VGQPLSLSAWGSQQSGLNGFPPTTKWTPGEKGKRLLGHPRERPAVLCVAFYPVNIKTTGDADYGEATSCRLRRFLSFQNMRILRDLYASRF